MREASRPGRNSSRSIQRSRTIQRELPSDVPRSASHPRIELGCGWIRSHEDDPATARVRRVMSGWKKLDESGAIAKRRSAALDVPPHTASGSAKIGALRASRPIKGPKPRNILVQNRLCRNLIRASTASLTQGTKATFQENGPFYGEFSRPTVHMSRGRANPVDCLRYGRSLEALLFPGRRKCRLITSAARQRRRKGRLCPGDGTQLG